MSKSIALATCPASPAAVECTDTLTRITRAAADRAYRQQQINQYLAQGRPDAAESFATAVRLVSRDAGPVYRPIARRRNLALMYRQNARSLAIAAGTRMAPEAGAR